MNKKLLLPLILGLTTILLIAVDGFLHKDIELWLHTTLLLLSGFAFIMTLLFFLIAVFGSIRFARGFLNFLIGDENTFSLSRLQAVSWAIVIMSSQISIQLAMIFNIHGNFYEHYEPVFSETTNWLLALSLSGYIAVKGITISQIRSNPVKYVRNLKKPDWRDLLVGDNGLDFSRCQMLIWTLIALVVYISKCYFFISYLPNADLKELSFVLRHMATIDVPIIAENNIPYVPYLPWSFIVLMGMSQGAYVGKKLVPTFKLDDFKAEKKQELSDKKTELEAKKSKLQNISVLKKGKTLSALDVKNQEALMEQIKAIEKDIADTSGEINQIDNALNK